MGTTEGIPGVVGVLGGAIAHRIQGVYRLVAQGIGDLRQTVRTIVGIGESAGIRRVTFFSNPVGQ
jgi:hypothetical protein